MQFLDSIVVSIPACHAGDRGSIPRRGGIFSLHQQIINEYYTHSFILLHLFELKFIYFLSFIYFFNLMKRVETFS